MKITTILFTRHSKKVKVFSAWRPAWVARNFNQPGQRLRLHPDDYFALGMQRGAIKERWFSSVVAASMDPRTPWDEGMSYIVCQRQPLR